MEDHSHSEEQKFFEAALELVHIAGRLVRDAFEQPAAEVMTKASNTDLVTETDQNVEKLIIEGLSKQFPSHKFIGEETVAGGGKVEWTDAPTWIIDPIDGTTNFVHRIPVIGICVGLSIGRKMRAGIVYNPVSNELFTAQVGKGAFRNGFPLRVSNTKVLSEAVIVLQLGSGRDPLMMTSYIDSFQRLMRDQEVHGCRSIGSAALSMIAVAQASFTEKGCVDGYAEYGIHAWDVAAAAVIVSEAGGILKDPTGAPFSIMSRKVLCAGTEELATALVATLTHVDFAPEA